MKNILTIYKFNFPFLFNKFEKIKYKAIVSDLKQLLLYDEIFTSKEIEVFDGYEIVKIKFNGGYIKIIYYYDNDIYYIPQFQLDIFIYNKSIDKLDKFLEEIIKVFITIGLKEYIFEFDRNIYNNYSDLVTIDKLEKNFKKYDYNSLKSFLENTSSKYVENKIKDNYVIRNSLYYMIYIYVFYILKTHMNLKKI